MGFVVNGWRIPEVIGWMMLMFGLAISMLGTVAIIQAGELDLVLWELGFTDESPDYYNSGHEGSYGFAALLYAMILFGIPGLLLALASRKMGNLADERFTRWTMTDQPGTRVRRCRQTLDEGIELTYREFGKFDADGKLAMVRRTQGTLGGEPIDDNRLKELFV